MGPDNGVCTPLLERAEAEGKPVEIVHLDNDKYWLPHVTAIFHGRDIFSPVGAHLAKGVPVKRLGSAEDVGAMCVYLASEEASWVTAQTFNLNGGSVTS